jgi:hypothetical protein
MERVIFFDAPVPEARSVGHPVDRTPVPAPPRKPLRASSVAVPSRGREREVQQLIHDLAVLAATRRPPH